MRLPLLVAVAILAVVAAFLIGRQRRQTSAAATDPDRQTLEALRDAGADLDKPTEVSFYLYFDREAQARQAAAMVEDSTLRTTVRPAAAGSAWLLLVQRRMVPAERAIHEARQRLQHIAASNGGEFDGWEAAIAR